MSFQIDSSVWVVDVLLLLKFNSSGLWDNHSLKLHYVSFSFDRCSGFWHRLETVIMCLFWGLSVPNE